MKKKTNKQTKKNNGFGYLEVGDGDGTTGGEIWGKIGFLGF